MSKLIISPLAIVPMERNRFLDGLPTWAYNRAYAFTQWPNHPIPSYQRHGRTIYPAWKPSFMDAGQWCRFQPCRAPARRFGRTRRIVLSIWKINAAESADNIKIFSEEALRLEKERLNAVALVELAKNLKAAQAEADLAALLEKMDFHLKQDDIFK